MWRILIITFLITSCARKNSAIPADTNIVINLNPPFYHQMQNWAAHPWKKDPSDSIPSGLNNTKQDSLADVFFLHPTTYTGQKTTWNADMNDTRLNNKTDFSSILYQASAFNEHARVFAPRYRQAHYSAFFVNNEETKKAFDTAYSDVKKAFDYYLLKHHHNRPIIIAAHSQGALLGIRLLKEYFDVQPLQKYLVGAYLVGWPLPQNVLTAIPVCKTAVQTGCFCGWRTFKSGFVPEYIFKEKTVSNVTNPLTWRTDSLYANKTLNKGGVLRDFNLIVPNVTDAQIHNGILWSGKPKFKGSIFFNTNNYHIADINLFYMNIRENVAQRIFAFLKEN